MQDFNKCCGLNGISKVKEFKITSKIFEAKRNNIKQKKNDRCLTDDQKDRNAVGGTVHHKPEKTHNDLI